MVKFARMRKIGILLLLLAGLLSCDNNWNNPYPLSDGSENTLYTAFSEKPKHLDPAISYSADEATFTYQIYEPPLQYDYLKRPYEVVPLIAQAMPVIKYFDKNNKEVTQTDPDVAYTIYRIAIQQGVYYQPHPAFAKKTDGEGFLYHHLTSANGIHTLEDFQQTATRELVAEDYVYEIKRIADPTINSPIYGLMEKHITGLKSFSEQLKKLYQEEGVKKGNDIPFINLRELPLEGAYTIDKYTYEIKLIGNYPQFIYWLAMPFFAPVPWEAVAFYAQTLLAKRNISLDWYPVGTGPYLLKENNPNLRMVLEKNPNFHKEYYPSKGTPEDVANGLLVNAGKLLPLINRIVFVLERESIPYWAKFLQGYYDQSGISSDNFDQAVKISGSGSIDLSEDIKSKGIRLSETVAPSIFYWGFNMLDDVVGGLTDSKRKLRQAISIAINVEEYINIFMNGRGTPAQNPLAPGIFGYPDDIAGVNPIIYNIDIKNNTYQRKSIEEAKRVLAQAGYPEGIDPKTNQPLVLYLDSVVSSAPDSQAQMSWIRKQFKKIGIELVVRGTQYNRFQDKIANGDVQIYFYGWNADYPDPENFLFLLYGPNGRAKLGGENASNYTNPAFDQLFEKMKSMPNSPERAQIINQMINILQKDAPWAWGFCPKIYTLRQQWINPFKPNSMARSTIKYMSIEPSLRAKLRIDWNHPHVWPLGIGFVLFILLCIPAALSYWDRQHKPLRLYNRD